MGDGRSGEQVGPPLRIRTEEPADRDGVRAVNEAAFGTPAEADLVDALREQVAPVVSLIAEEDGRIVGHIMFSPVRLDGRDDPPIAGLGPMAVLPCRQRRGIGSRLLVAGLERCRQLGFAAVVVLGHPAFYARAGFVPAVRFGIGSEYDVADELFMARELRKGGLRGATGTIRYHDSFRNV